MRTLLLIFFTLLSASHASTGRQQFYIDVQEHVRSCPPVKGKVPVDMTGGEGVQIDFIPFQILSVDEVSQGVSYAAVMALIWFYPECGWNVTDFGGVKGVQLKTEDLWYPEILTPKSMKTGFIIMPEHVTISNNGTVIAQIPDGFDTGCYLDFSNYPFDEHNCSFPFLESRGQSLEIAKQDVAPSFDLKKHFGTSAEWMLAHYGCGSFQNQVNYTECWFTMNRRSIFYKATLIFPVGAMCVTTFLVFCIPAESGEKMSFLISLFVSMTVFINFIVDVIPRSMDKLPKLVWMIMAVMLIIGLVTAVTTFILRRYHQEEKEKKEKKRAQRKQANRIAQQDMILSDLQDMEESEVVDDDDIKQKSLPPNIECDQPKRKPPCRFNHRQLDSFCFVFFFFFAIIVTLVSILSR